jgi:hypothetical protein
MKGKTAQDAIRRIMAAAKNTPQIEVTVQRQDLEVLLTVVAAAIERPGARLKS